MSSATLQDAVAIQRLHTSSRHIATGDMRLSRGELETARRHREWLRQLPKRLGMPLTRIAKLSNVATSTLTRPLNEGEDGTSTLRATTIEKIVQRHHVTPPDTPGVVQVRAQSHSEARILGDPYRSEGELLALSTEDPHVAAVARALAHDGRCEVWRLWLDLEGDLLVARDLLAVALDRQPRPNDLVLGEVRHPDGVSHVFRTYAPPHLIARSGRGPLMKPLYVDDDTVKVRGVVIASARLSYAQAP